MELNQKLQELRKQKGLTQEELAKALYVSRTAVSKWESGRGVPSIESLRAIAAFFSVTVDDLLSSDEILRLAETNQKQTKTHLRDLALGLADLCMALLLFLPLFAERSGDFVRSVSLIGLEESAWYLKIAYFSVVIGTVLWGILTLALQNLESPFWGKSKGIVSLILGGLAVLLFMVTLNPYATVFSFVLLAMKVVLNKLI